MDIDPSIYFQPSSPDPSVPTTPPQNSLGSPLPHVNLPALPRPSVSPASTRVSFTQQQKSGRASAGLDLSASMQQNYSSTSYQLESGEKDHSLEDVSLFSSSQVKYCALDGSVSRTGESRTFKKRKQFNRGSSSERVLSRDTTEGQLHWRFRTEC